MYMCMCVGVCVWNTKVNLFNEARDPKRPLSKPLQQ